MLALRNLRDKYPQYRAMVLNFERNPMVRIEVERVHAWGERFRTSGVGLKHGRFPKRQGRPSVAILEALQHDSDCRRSPTLTDLSRLGADLFAMAVPWPSCRHSPFGHCFNGSAGGRKRPRVLNRHHHIVELGTSTFLELPDAFRWLTDGL
jgi:hypothetical protein